MSLATVIEQFRSRYSKQCEQSENSASLDVIECSQRSLCSQQVSDSKPFLMQLVSNACVGLQADPQKVIDRLLSTTDEQDILNGLTPRAMLRAHIQLWLKQGIRYYSGKK